MKKLARLSVTLLALLLVLLGAGAATAQDDTNYGELVIIVFDPNGLPVDGVRIRQEGATVGTTDDEGTVILRLRAGDTSLSFQKDGYPSEPTPLIPIVAGRSVEVLVTYSKRGGTNLLDIERPEGEGLSTTTATATGRIEGTIINDKGRPVEDARIFVRGAPVDARSDEQGRFVLDGVPATNLDLTIIHPNYGTTNKNDVEVKADETVIVGVEVEPSAGFSQEFVVTIPKLEGGAVFVLAERRESSSVADLLGADQIQKSGDSDAAAALQRVTGITLVGGRYVYVRGLGERYSTTLLDGSILPSPDPEQRVVPLDLFPASILGSIVVQKTYSPDLPGEFGGGTVNLRTRAVPEEFELKLGASLGYRTGTTFDTASGYDGTSLDFLGFGLDGRNPSPALREALDGGRVGRLSREELQQLGLEQNLDFGLRPQTVDPNIGLSATLGGSIDLGDETSIGALVGATYGRNWFAREMDYTISSNGTIQADGSRSLVVGVPLRLLDLINDTNLGGLGILSFTINEQNKVMLTTSLNRISENSARLQWGTTPENDTRLNRLRWVEMQLLTAQLRGEHTEMFGLPLRADWRYMLSTASRDEPDRREIAYLLEPAASSPVNRTTYRLDELDIFNQRFYSTLADLIHDVGADVELNVPIVGEVETKFKAGVAMLLKTRDVETRRLGYDPRNSLFSTLPASEIFNEESLGGDRPSFLLEEVTENTDSYTASQDVFAGYLMTDFGLLENLRVLGGARVEASTQRVETFLPDGEPTPGLDPSELNTFDVLPALTLTWEFIQDMQLRFAASRTLSRPNLRELSPARFREFGGALILEGNPNLERTLIWNLDARYEWYPSPGESFSTSFFYKRFENPVERTGSTGATPTFRPINIDSAFVVGGEIDTRVEFGFIDDVLADLYFAGNLTVVFSEVQIPPEEQGALTTLERPMALQSPWVINAQVGYDNPEIGLSASLLYNLFGPRIWAVGTLEAPDFYEQPFDQLDAVINWKVDRFKFTVKGKNLMDPVARVTQEQPTDGTEFLVQAFRRGRVFSIGIGVDLN